MVVPVFVMAELMSANIFLLMLKVCVCFRKILAQVKFLSMDKGDPQRASEDRIGNFIIFLEKQ
jgi:hypothetical protein